MLQSRPFYGWKLLTALAAIVSINVGMTYVAAGVVNAPMARALGMSRGTLGLGSTVFLLCLGLSAPLVARSVNSLGSRATLCVGSLLVSLGSVLLASCVSRGWQFVLGYGLLLGTGCGFGGIAPAHSCATLWFEKRRAMALALVLVGAGLGGSIFAPLLTRLIAAANGNWHAGWSCLCAASLMAALMSILFVKNHPEEVGQVADGERQAVSEVINDAASRRSRVYRTRDHWTLKEAAHTPTFWLLTLAAVGESVPGTSTIAHAVPHLRDLGHSAAAAGAALGLFSTSSIFGSLTVGFSCDRVEPRIVWAVCISLIGAGMLVATRARADAAMYLFTGMLGFGSGAALTCWHATVGNYFGPSSFPSILCAQLPISNTIAAASPFLVGIVYDVRGSYTPAFVSLAAFSILAAIFLFFTRPPTRLPAAIPQSRTL
ncbi:MAG TPA: MFS transporter [Steroidobacteraceae bacterium]|nr:MFS transporter [Steroidobacteraceae bacterium]